MTQAFELQIQVAQLRLERGESLAGYKIGCLSEAIQKQFGLQRPVFGHVFSTELHSSATSLDSQFYDGLAVEGEFAFRIKQDVPDAAWLRKRREQAIATVFAVIELHNYVFRSTPPVVQELIANNALHAGVVLPDQENPSANFDALLNEPISVFKNGTLLGTTTGSALPGGPFGSLLQLVEQLGDFGIRLKRDQIVLTGSPLPLYRVSSGDHMEVECQRLAPVTVEIQ